MAELRKVNITTVKKVYIHAVKSFVFVAYKFSRYSGVGLSTKLRTQRTMKLGKQFDIDI